LLVRLDTIPALLLLTALFAATTPNLAHGWSLQTLGREQPRPPLDLQRRVRALQALNLQRAGVVLDSAGFCTAFFAGLPVRFVYYNTKDVPFRQFMQRGNIGIVFLDRWLSNDAAYRDDPEFQEFAAGTSSSDDFAYVPVPELKLRIAVRKDLLPPAVPAIAAIPAVN
jgi:hypothetical protein